MQISELLSERVPFFRNSLMSIVRRTSRVFLVSLAIGASFFALPVFAAVSPPTLVVNNRSNTITAANQSAVSVTGSSGLNTFTGNSLRSGTTTVVVTDSVGTTLTKEKVFEYLDTKTYSFSFDTTSLVDGPIVVSMHTIATEGNSMASLSATLTKQTSVSSPEFAFFLLPAAFDSDECINRPGELLPYSSTTPTRTEVCVLLATTTLETFTPINTAAHLFSQNDSFTFTYTDSLGNPGASTVTVSNIDNDAPVVFITIPENGATIGQAFTPDISATDLNTVTFGCALDSVALSDCIAVIGGLAGGTHMFSVNAIDAAGNNTARHSFFTVAFAEPTLKFSATSSSSALVPIDASATTTLQIASGTGTSTVAIGAGTLITRNDAATLSTSDVSITAPDTATFANIATGAIVGGALQWGIPGVGLEFSQPITMSLYVGTALNGTTLSIYRSPALTSGWTQDGLLSPSCTVTDGLCVFATMKASYFASVHVPPVYEPTPVPEPVQPPSGGGGGGIIGGMSVSGGGPIPASMPVIVRTTPTSTIIAEDKKDTPQGTGVVLGASTYNFAHTLAIGSYGGEIKALQERLLNEGMYAWPVTSYFGILTHAAVKAFQRKYGIADTGIVGPLTRAELNKGIDHEPPILRETLTEEQVGTVISLLKALNVDSQTMERVRASLK